jgi:hypothetical protein
MYTFPTSQQHLNLHLKYHTEIVSPRSQNQMLWKEKEVAWRGEEGLNIPFQEFFIADDINFWFVQKTDSFYWKSSSNLLESNCWFKFLDKKIINSSPKTLRSICSYFSASAMRAFSETSINSNQYQNQRAWA